MEWSIWITWWIMLYIRYSRLFEYILKNRGEKTVNPSIKIYVNKIEDRIAFKMKTGYYLELLTPKTMKLLWSSKGKITKDKNGENLPYLEITEVVLTHCNVVNNSRDISPKNVIFLKTFDSEFSYIEVWFADQNFNPLKIKGKIDNTVVIN